MSYNTWHTYGYGICVSDLGDPPVERIQDLLAMAPAFQREVQEWLDERGITDPDPDDYMEFDQDFMLGFATILKKVILEAENVELKACDSPAGEDYLLFVPDYPWNQKNRKRLKTEEEVQDLFRKYVSILTDEPIIIDYQSVENGE